MDQLASLGGRTGCALLMDCRSLELTPISLPDDLGLIVVHSGLPRTLAGSAYAERRAACEDAARRLGVAALRDATIEQVADDPRGRHVVSENARVLATVDALRSGDLAQLGQLLVESHASLRDDFEVSTPTLDALAARACEAGALGARMMGGGFGGAVVALAEAERTAEVAAVAEVSYVCEAVDGARAWQDHES
jgi:galactokinase